MNSITYKNIKYFQSDLLTKNNFIHAFFTKRYKNNTPRELQNELNLVSSIHSLKQVHSNKIIQIDNRCNSHPITADGLLTKEKYKSLWIYTADCIPILIADRKTRNVAAFHCGLEGLRKQIIKKILEKLVSIGSNKNNLIIAIGPSISGVNYQVNIKDIEDLIIMITGDTYKQKNCPFIEKNKKELIPLYQKDSNPGKFLFDIQAAATLQFHKEDIKKTQININRLCTYSNPKIFNSFRRDHTRLRQWSCIYS